jgi:hypothetical protein
MVTRFVGVRDDVAGSFRRIRLRAVQVRIRVSVMIVALTTAPVPRPGRGLTRCYFGVLVTDFPAGARLP